MTNSRLRRCSELTTRSTDLLTYLVRRLAPNGAKSPPAKALERTEEHAGELAREQAALRQVATLVACRPSPDQLFAAVAEQVARVFNVPLVRLVRYESDDSVVLGGFSESDDAQFPIGSCWPKDSPGVVATVRQTGRPARVEDYAHLPGQSAAVARRAGMRSAVGSPIVVEGRLWGAMVALSPQREHLAEGTEDRLADFTELLGAAISNAEDRRELQRIAAEQEALRKAATLVACGASPPDVFAAITTSAAEVFGVPFASLIRVGPHDTATMVAGSAVWSTLVGQSWEVPPDDPGITRTVVDSGRPSRLDDHSRVRGPVGEAARAAGLASIVGAPVIVDGSVWGVLVVGAAQGESPPAPDAADRLASFAELVSTAIVDTEARDHIRRLLDEQAALRRVATLVAEGATPDRAFEAVRQEVEEVFNVPLTVLWRYDADGLATMLATGPEGYGGPIGSRWRLEGDTSAGALVRKTGRAVRVDYAAPMHGSIADAARSGGCRLAVGVPIVVEGAVWGAMTVGTDEPEQWPADLEDRLAKFTELLATTIANAESRAELAASEARAHRLAREQAALRRVATLVAESATAAEVFSAVAREVARVFDVQLVTICRYEVDAIVVLSHFGAPAFPADSRWPLEVPSLPRTVYETGKPARLDEFTNASGLDAIAHDAGTKAAVGAPIVVDGSVWGSINVATTEDQPFPTDAEERLARFTELVATSVSNATMRGELAASRARVIAAADDARRRIERDLHDGAQQQLVTLMLALQRAEGKIPGELAGLRAEVNRVAKGLTAAVEELREMSRGIHPAVLTEGGLSPALKALGRRSPVPVKLDVRCEDRLPDQLEVAAYYIVSEALTNASKHATASGVWISLGVEEDTLHLSIRDDGVGGADPSRGSGLIGLRDRVEALQGTIDVVSPLGSGTRINVDIPLHVHHTIASPSLD